MLRDEKIEVIKPGISTAVHECSWKKGSLNPDAPSNVYDYQRICRVCGKVEHVFATIEEENFDSIYEKFYEQGKDR